MLGIEYMPNININRILKMRRLLATIAISASLIGSLTLTCRSETPPDVLAKQAFRQENSMNIERLELLLSNSDISKKDYERIIIKAMEGCIFIVGDVRNDVYVFIKKYMAMDTRAPWYFRGLLFDANAKNAYGRSKDKDPTLVYIRDRDLTIQSHIWSAAINEETGKFAAWIIKHWNSDQADVRNNIIRTNCLGESLPYAMVRTGDFSQIRKFVENGIINIDTLFPYSPVIPRYLPIYDKYVSVDRKLSDVDGFKVVAATKKVECPWEEMKKDGLVISPFDLILATVFRHSNVPTDYPDDNVIKTLSIMLKAGSKIGSDGFHRLFVSSPMFYGQAPVPTFSLSPSQEYLLDDFLASGADINHVLNGKTPLQKIIENNEFGWPKKTLLNAFLKRGAKPSNHVAPINRVPKIRPPLPRQPLGLGAPPGGDPAVVAAGENIRDAAALEELRAGVLRIFQQAGREALLGARAALPITPGISRTQASMSAIAAISPPDST